MEKKVNTWPKAKFEENKIETKKRFSNKVDDRQKVAVWKQRSWVDQNSRLKSLLRRVQRGRSSAVVNIHQLSLRLIQSPNSRDNFPLPKFLMLCPEEGRFCKFSAVISLADYSICSWSVADLLPIIMKNLLTWPSLTRTIFLSIFYAWFLLYSSVKRPQKNWEKTYLKKEQKYWCCAKYYRKLTFYLLEAEKVTGPSSPRLSLTQPLENLAMNLVFKEFVKRGIKCPLLARLGKVKWSPKLTPCSNLAKFPLDHMTLSGEPWIRIG